MARLAVNGEDALNYRFGDFEIDIARQELQRGGQLVPVEPQVFDLLVYLVRNHNRVVSKTELIDAVWNGRIVSEAALSSRVSTARRAIGDTGAAQSLIRTHHKRGFRFVGTLSRPAVKRHVASEPHPLGAGAAHAGSVYRVSGDASIAVLPFQNVSGDPCAQLLADNLSEDIIAGLGRQQWCSVAARSASFSFKGVNIDMRVAARKLGVRYVLEGSTRRAAGRLRVTAQLVDAARRVHVWADHFDSVFSPATSRQDDISARVVDAVKSQVIMAEAARLRRQVPQSLGANDLVLQALPHMWRMSAEEQRRAQDLLAQAAERGDDGCTHAQSHAQSHGQSHGQSHVHALLGFTYVSMFNLDSRTPINELTEKALDAGAKALALDDREHWGHLVLGLGHARRRRTGEAIGHLAHAIALKPSFALGHAALGYALACGGQPEQGLRSLECAQRASPLDPFLAIYAPIVRYMALFALERYEETISVCRSAAARHPNHAGAHRLMTVSLGLLGKIDEAQASLARTLALQPDLSSDHVINATVYANEADRSRFLLGLQRAGLSN